MGCQASQADLMHMQRRHRWSVQNEAIFERIQQVTGVKNPNQLAKYLHMTAQAVHDGLRGEVPERWFYQIAAMEQCRVDWLRTGDGPPFATESDSDLLSFLRAMREVLPHLDAQEREILLRCAELMGQGGPEIREFLSQQFRLLSQLPRRSERDRHSPASTC